MPTHQYQHSTFLNYIRNAFLLCVKLVLPEEGLWTITLQEDDLNLTLQDSCYRKRIECVYVCIFAHFGHPRLSRW